MVANCEASYCLKNFFLVAGKDALWIWKLKTSSSA